MLGSASSEFIALCQSQVLLLSQTLNASSTVVYLAEQSNELASPTLVPLVAYPDNADLWTGLQGILSTIGHALLEAPQGSPGLLTSGSAEVDADLASIPNASLPGSEDETVNAFVDAVATAADAATPTDEPGPKGNHSQPLILPLVHKGIVLGLMVSTRKTPPWNREDYQQAEQVAKSLAIARVMDQRNQCLRNQLQQRQLTQTDQSQTFHDLLHQFRNPLTALQTFGKLLLKRMQPGDPNQSIAEGIVRETRRLQNLAQNFDEAVARGDAELEQTAVALPVDQLLLPAADRPTKGDEDSALTLEQPNVYPTKSPRPGEENVTPPRPLSSQTTASKTQEHGYYSLGRDLEIGPGTITAVVEPLLLTALAIAQDRGMALVQDLPPDLPEVWLDADALREVISNLLDNAFKYAPQGSLIWVFGGLVKHLDGILYQGIAIGDTGPGIPLQDQDHIFERHYRGVQAESRTPGTGLGLAIVRELVKAMGGHIDLISPIQIEQWLPADELPHEKGPGSLFIVWLKTV